MQSTQSAVGVGSESSVQLAQPVCAHIPDGVVVEETVVVVLVSVVPQPLTVDVTEIQVWVSEEATSVGSQVT